MYLQPSNVHCITGCQVLVDEMQPVHIHIIKIILEYTSMLAYANREVDTKGILVWAREKFPHTYVIGKASLLETDHKP